MLIVQFNSYYFKCYLTLLLCQYSGHDYYEMEALHELSPIDKF
jgi:Mg-chelatase subunit ChlD